MWLHSGVIRSCQAATPASHERPCSTKISCPSGLRTRLASCKAATGAFMEHKVQVTTTVSMLVFSIGRRASADCIKNLIARAYPRTACAPSLPVRWMDQRPAHVSPLQNKKADSVRSQCQFPKLHPGHVESTLVVIGLARDCASPSRAEWVTSTSNTNSFAIPFQCCSEGCPQAGLVIMPALPSGNQKASLVSILRVRVTKLRQHELFLAPRFDVLG